LTNVRESQAEGREPGLGPTASEPGGLPPGFEAIPHESAGVVMVWMDQRGRPVDGGIAWWHRGELRTSTCGTGYFAEDESPQAAFGQLLDMLERRGVQLRLW
jgi:hypothetical protein